MKPWQFVIVVLALVATSGCRSDPAIPILERELRLKDDEIYRLRANLEDLQDTRRLPVTADPRFGLRGRGRAGERRSAPADNVGRSRRCTAAADPISFAAVDDRSRCAQGSGSARKFAGAIEAVEIWRSPFEQFGPDFAPDGRGWERAGRGRNGEKGFAGRIGRAFYAFR